MNSIIVINWAYLALKAVGGGSVLYVLIKWTGIVIMRKHPKTKETVIRDQHGNECREAITYR